MIVEDNGIGIREKYLDKVWDMFFRASENSQGAGLGLYIVKKTVELMHGQIMVKSKFGEYTRFVLTIPNTQLAKKA